MSKRKTRFEFHDYDLRPVVVDIFKVGPHVFSHVAAVELELEGNGPLPVYIACRGYRPRRTEEVRGVEGWPLAVTYVLDPYHGQKPKADVRRSSLRSQLAKMRKRSQRA